MFLIAVGAGIISAAIVVAYFVAIDRYRTTAAAATNGSFAPQGPKPSLIKQFETMSRPFMARLPSAATIQVRQKLSRAETPADLRRPGSRRCVIAWPR